MTHDFDLLFESDRFEWRKSKPNSINECCFGEDVGHWLRRELAARGVEAAEPGQEDWGWYLPVVIEGRHVDLCINTVSDPDDARATWCIGFDPRLSWLECVLRRKETAAACRLSAARALVAILRDAPFVHDLRAETDRGAPAPLPETGGTAADA